MGRGRSFTPSLGLPSTNWNTGGGGSFGSLPSLLDDYTRNLGAGSRFFGSLPAVDLGVPESLIGGIDRVIAGDTLSGVGATSVFDIPDFISGTPGSIGSSFELTPDFLVVDKTISIVDILDNPTMGSPTIAGSEFFDSLELSASARIFNTGFEVRNTSPVPKNNADADGIRAVGATADFYGTLAGGANFYQKGARGEQIYRELLENGKGTPNRILAMQSVKRLEIENANDLIDPSLNAKPISEKTVKVAKVLDRTGKIADFVSVFADSYEEYVESGDAKRATATGVSSTLNVAGGEAFRKAALFVAKRAGLAAIGLGGWPLVLVGIGATIGWELLSRTDTGKQIKQDVTNFFDDVLKGKRSVPSSNSAGARQAVDDALSGGLLLGPPIVVDLDGDGIEMVDLLSTTATFQWDADSDFVEKTGWVAPDDALLVIDLAPDGTAGADGIINRSDELSLTAHVTGAATDLEALADPLFDSNQDGIFDAQDARFGEFRLWRDLDQDGVADSGELITLADAGLLSLKLASRAFNGENPTSNIIHAVTDVEWAATSIFSGDLDGAEAITGLAGDVSLRYDASGAKVETTAGGDRLITTEAGQKVLFTTATGGTTLNLATAGVDSVVGTDSADTLSVGHDGGGVIYGAGGNDLITGGAGTDYLSGGAGADTISAGAGDDIITVDADDVLTGDVGGAGADLLKIESTQGLTVDAGAIGIETVFGGDGGDILSTSGADSVALWGFGGNDSLTGGTNSDLLVGGDSDDILAGGAGADRLDGGLGADEIRGMAGRRSSTPTRACPGPRSGGSQFTSWAWTQRLRDAGVRISMDGRGRYLDNIFIERLWRSLKYECVYLHAFSGGREARQGIGDWMSFYNHRRPHAAHGGETPVGVYRERLSASGPGLRPDLHPTALVA